MSEEQDPKVSAAYRQLAAEEPPSALDDAILAAARREAGARPALRGRAGRNRWYAPLAAAAVLVLAVAVTLNMQLEQPDIAEPAPRAKQTAAPPASAPSRADVPARVEATRETVKNAAKPMIAKPGDAMRSSAPEPFPAKEERAMADRRIAASPQAAAPAPPAVLSSRSEEARDAASSGAAASAPLAAPAQAQSAAKRAAGLANVPADTPERELERIAELRGQGRQEEADRALAEFRKRYPDYRIPEEMRLRIERR